MIIRKWLYLVVVSSLTFNAGCTTIDPYTREVSTSNTSIGTGLGAIGGAIVGSMAGHSTKSALLGAGIGALAGSVIGNSLDQEENLLRQQLENTGVRVDRLGDTIRLIMPCDITFSNDSAQLLPDFYETLDSVAIILKRFNKTLVNVAGYTSNTGSLMHNQLLSEQRAKHVAHFLIEEGINPTRIITAGFGVRKPIATNETEEGRALNRRVEITIRAIEFD